MDLMNLSSKVRSIHKLFLLSIFFFFFLLTPYHHSGSTLGQIHPRRLLPLAMHQPARPAHGLRHPAPRGRLHHVLRLRRQLHEPGQYEPELSAADGRRFGVCS